MSADIVRRLDEAVVKMVKRPDYIKDLASVGNLPTHRSPAEMPAYVQEEIKTLRDVQVGMAPAR